MAAGDPEVPRNWDELASKLERKFRALLKKLDAMRAELEDAERRARQLEHRLLREVSLNG